MFDNYSDWTEFPDDIEVRSEPKSIPLRFNPLYRLLDERNEVLRAFVRKITIKDWSSTDKTLVWPKLQAPQNLLAGLIEKLPNLEEVYFEEELPITAELIDVMLTHKSTPKLYLLGEDGHTPTTTNIPFVPEVRIRVDAEATRPDRDVDFEPQRLALHEIFAAYPNLESLSVSVNRLVGGCVLDMSPPCTQILPLSLHEKATIPPLQRLSLSGYKIQKNERSTWKTRFPWNKLKSLSLGVQDNYNVLEVATGKVHDLREFVITGLEIDLDPKNTWPDDKLIKAIATRFPNLHQMTIHFGLGIARAEMEVKKYESSDRFDPYDLESAGIDQFFVLLTEESARKFFKQFLEYRGPSNLKKFTLKTGEDLRWFPQWPPDYSEAEQRCAKTFELDTSQTHNGEISLKELDTPYARFERMLNRMHDHGGNDNDTIEESQRINEPRILK
ncbi:hypothetical protein N7450_008000 [Penicillium hetheringtonii]|uniref:Uncharacterized protein n=1 Tax=Penicillium hetheringtonii TaxID=911720 RepID=A0AAD6DFB9_9EURO|nr:hypothetical protein N7450_008000 [Penicillium hetheringtonii]